MPAQDTEWTADMVRALPYDGTRYEVLNGALFVTPAPALPHQRALHLLSKIIDPYVVQHGLGETFLSPADVEFSPRDLVQPDLFVVPPLPQGKLRRWADITSLLLAVEVLSPSTARADRQVKRALYLREHVPQYWIVDLDARLVERWTPDDMRPDIVTDALLWTPQPEIASLVIELPSFFSMVLD